MMDRWVYLLWAAFGAGAALAAIFVGGVVWGLGITVGTAAGAGVLLLESAPTWMGVGLSLLTVLITVIVLFVFANVPEVPHDSMVMRCAIALDERQQEDDP